MLGAEIRRRKLNTLFEMIDQFAEVSGEPMANDEINSEVAAARAGDFPKRYHHRQIPTRRRSKNRRAADKTGRLESSSRIGELNVAVGFNPRVNDNIIPSRGDD
jgi:hypothetical protein